MCGRYYIDDETANEIEKLIREIQGEPSRETAAALLRSRRRTSARQPRPLSSLPQTDA